MAATRTKRFETRLDEATDQLITRAAELTQMSKSAFVTGAARAEAEKIVARAEITLLDPRVFDALIVSLDVADDAPALRDKLASLPRIS